MMMIKCIIIIINCLIVYYVRARMVSLAAQKLIIQIIRNAQSERELRKSPNSKVL